MTIGAEAQGDLRKSDEEVKRGLESGEIEDVQESLKKKASDPDEAEQSVDIVRGN